MKQLIPTTTLQRKIYLIQGQKVMLDSDLAELYGVSTKRLNEQVKRNRSRFPADFLIRLSEIEVEVIRSLNATLETPGRGRHRKYLPYAFTEQGVAMLSSVLTSERAIQVNIAIMRAFVDLREMVATHKKLAQKLGQLERRIGEHDEDIRSIFQAIYELTAPKKIGFKS